MAAHGSTYVRNPPWWSGSYGTQPTLKEGKLTPLWSPLFGNRINFPSPPPGTPPAPTPVPTGHVFRWSGMMWMLCDAEAVVLLPGEAEDVELRAAVSSGQDGEADIPAVGSPSSAAKSNSIRQHPAAANLPNAPAGNASPSIPTHAPAPAPATHATPSTPAGLPCISCMRYLKEKPDLICTHNGSMRANGSFTSCNNCKRPRNTLCRTVPTGRIAEATQVHRLAERVPLQTPNGWTLRGMDLTKNKKLRKDTNGYIYPAGTPQEFKDFYAAYNKLLKGLPNDRVRSQQMLNGIL